MRNGTSDRALVRQIRDGERERLEVLITRHYDAVWRYLRAQSGNAELAYDLTQEVFLRFCRHFDRFAGEERLPAYLLRIARNLLIDEYRAARPSLSLEAAEVRAAAGDFAEAADLRADLARAMDALPAPQREAVTLHYLCGLRLREIAALTGVGTATAKSRLRLGTEKLKELLEKEGYR